MSAPARPVAYCEYRTVRSTQHALGYAAQGEVREVVATTPAAAALMTASRNCLSASAINCPRLPGCSTDNPTRIGRRKACLLDLV